MSRLKETIKKNEAMYKALYPVVERKRVIEKSFVGSLRSCYPIFRNGNFRRLAEFKNLYAGKQCFVIANGPSLEMGDLDRIADSYSIGCNHIHTVFNNTLWRPTYWGCTDGQIIDSVMENRPVEIPLFTRDSVYKQMEDKRNVLYVSDVDTEKHVVNVDMLSWWSMSATVAVFNIELAMYMGFNPIILLGYDCTFSIKGTKHAGEDAEVYTSYSKIYENDIKKAERLGKTSEEFDYMIYEMIMKDYESIKQMADKLHINILNATRGGELEVYPRVNFDELFKNRWQHKK